MPTDCPNCGEEVDRFADPPPVEDEYGAWWHSECWGDEIDAD